MKFLGGNSFQLFRFLWSGRFNHAREYPKRVLQEFVRNVVLFCKTGIHYEHPVRVHDCMQTMCNRDNGKIFEVYANCFLNERIGLWILKKKESHHTEKVCVKSGSLCLLTTFAVASSRTSTLLLRRIARAKQINCR